ncbi:MAG TPA: hypothetical protein DCM10_00970 [Xanthomarina gelatinilytica]|nr:hypothetical protein [Xanthomarina gelatinilytica]
MKLKSKELKDLIKATFPEAREIIVTDNDYAYLDYYWIENEAYDGYKHWMSIFDFGRGIKNSDWKRNFDCEDLANSFKIYLKMLHAQANPNTFSEQMDGKSNESNTESILAGTIAFKNSSSSAHSINIFIDSMNKIRYFEPMYGRFINLSKGERESIWYVNF